MITELKSLAPGQNPTCDRSISFLPLWSWGDSYELPRCWRSQSSCVLFLSLVPLAAGYRALILTSTSFPLLLMKGQPYASRCTRHWGPNVNELPSLLKDLPVFTPAFFQAVPCTAARVPVLSPKDGLVTPALPTPATAPTAFRGRLGSWTWSAGDNPCSPQVLPPAASPSRFSSWASVLLPTGLLSACQAWLFPSILRTWGVCVLCWGAPASPFPLGNCCLIWGDHLSGLFLTR